ncbi:hypothetical protein BHE74_00036778 [Ensete ventricosum]|nr:hypothetical protein BHE74_00036778 [Ensete ventricosum]
MKKTASNEEGTGSESPMDAIGAQTGGGTSFSGPLTVPLGDKNGVRFSVSDSPSPAASAKGTEEEDATYVEITLDVRDDAVAVHSVKAAGGGGDGEGDPEVAALARELERRSAAPAFGSSVMRTASLKFRQVSQEIRRLASFGRRSGVGKLDRTRSAAAHALKGLKFISRADGAAGWAAVERRFDELAVDGNLHRSRFAQCIGSFPFAEEYAALIMEELDPDNLGYIEVREVSLERWRNGLADLSRG